MECCQTVANNSPKRLGYIDCARGICIISIMIIHHLKVFPALHLFLSMFAVPSFFILSGFLFECQNQTRYSLKEFIVKKLKSLMYPYFTFSVLIILWNVFFYRVLLHSDPEISVGQIVLLLFSTFGYQAFWFVPCLFWAMILFFIVRKTKLYHKIFLAFSVVFIAVNFYFQFFRSETLPFGQYYVIRYIYRILISSVFVYIGSVLCNIMGKGYDRVLFVVSFVSSMATFLLLNVISVNMNWDISTMQIGYLGLFYFTGTTFVCWMILLLKKGQSLFLEKGIAFFGKNSLIIMFLHMDVSVEIAYIVLGFFHLGWSMETLSILVIPLELVILAVIIWLMNKFFSWMIRIPKRKSVP